MKNSPRGKYSEMWVSMFFRQRQSSFFIYNFAETNLIYV